jgi:hypothetical protein
MSNIRSIDMMFLDDVFDMGGGVDADRRGGLMPAGSDWLDVSNPIA